MQPYQSLKVVQAFHAYIPECTCTCAQISGPLSTAIGQHTWSWTMGYYEKCINHMENAALYKHTAFINRSMKQTVILAWGLFLKRKTCCHASQRLATASLYTCTMIINDVNDKKRILSSLCDLHLFMKVKAAVQDWLALGGVLPFMKSNFGLLLWLLFVDGTPPFTVGMLHLEALTR